ncbi:DUF2264 domain-containing protein [Halomontanus rarus]|uniref:DUF2264 domain-containing protein n=1 Tax=Halomontanus rarus TaxID=3034020 RepID=UPI0023E85CA0|nr:DUF2264 domain-containing protein [Halovivax sp. TS33]
MNPLADNPLETRSDAQRAVVDLFDPLEAHFSPGRARMKPDVRGAHFPDAAAELEGFSRPLWGLVPLAADGDGAFDGWSSYRTGLANGVDPDHPEYWGEAPDHSQKHVEMAAIGLGLALTPEELWDPLEPSTRENLVEWLSQINDASLYGCNWLFFRVVVNLGLREVGADHDWELTQETLDELESYYLEGGWYADGPAGERPCDYYIPWAMHFYGLVYAAVAGDDDPERAARFRDRAAQFAAEHRHWFAEDGAGLPYGRSLTYRFAQAGFWGALAFADVDVEEHGFSWGEIRGLWFRNLRWWADQPIFTDGGVLSIGYRYPSLKVSEPYNSPSSPYWGMKAFVPLALPEDHPFWRADEQPLTGTAELTVQEEPKMVICRDEEAGHHYALTAGQNSHYLEKYTKFAYSTQFGFSVRSRAPGIGGAGHDSSLALSADGSTYRSRCSVTDSSVSAEGPTLRSRWDPWDDVTVETWLVPASPWHVRLHRLSTDRHLHSAEGGFPVDKTGDDRPDRHTHEEGEGSALVRYPAGTSGLCDLEGHREGSVITQDPNTNLVAPRTVVPTLTASHDPGTHWLVSGVTAATADRDAAWDRPPRLTIDDDLFVVTDADGDELLRHSRSNSDR